MSKKAWLLPVFAAVLAVTGSGAAFALPSLGGPTGLVSVPNALVAPAARVEAAVSWQNLKMYEPAGSETFSDWALQVLGGVGSGAELWAAYSTANDDLGTKSWGLGAKLQFAHEPQEVAALAVGGSFQQASGDTRIVSSLGTYSDIDLDTDVTKLYVVLTKDFTPAGLTTEWAVGTRVLGTAGLLWAKAKTDETFRSDLGTERFSGDEDLLRPFVGAEFASAAGTTLGLEYRWRDRSLDRKGVFSAVLRHLFGQRIVAEIGTTNADLLGFGLSDQNFFARVAYAFARAGY